MKFCKTFPRTMLCCLFIASLSQGVNGQFLKKLGEKAEKAAERTVENRVERESAKKTDKALDGILEPGKNEKKKEKKNNQDTGGAEPQTNTQENTNNGNDTQAASQTGTTTTSEKSITVYSKFDFVPGDKLLFFDDFSNEFVGDFPSKWNTNGTGEVVTINDSPDKWFEIKPGYNVSYIPDVPKLPEEYTIELDLRAIGLSSSTYASTTLSITLGDQNTFTNSKNKVRVAIPLAQRYAESIKVENLVDGKQEMYSNINADIRPQLSGIAHISIAVNKQRYRLWINESKYLDIPRIVPAGITSLQFQVSNLQIDTERVFLRNLKVAEGGKDLRRTLISEGKVSTNGILFDSGSANIQPQSMGIILQIFQVLQQEQNLRLKIVGHTDADGNDQTNLELSKKRAEAVKNALTSVYNISPDRLQTDGKGESEPVGDNTTTDGKAQNRRVEFLKI